MNLVGIEQLTYGVNDLRKCSEFFVDWGLRETFADAREVRLETLNGSTVRLLDIHDPALPPPFEPGSTLREVTWGVRGAGELDAYRARLRGQPGFFEQEDAIGCIDPNGMGVRIEVTRRRPLEVQGSLPNVWGKIMRIDKPTAVYERAEPVEIGHIVQYTDCLVEHEQFYHEVLGFTVSDRYPDKGTFMRCEADGVHHHILIIKQQNGKRGLNHVSFTLRDIHEVFGGGLYVSRKGWQSGLGPGRHFTSSAYYWYFANPAGGLVEYAADEDVLSAAWQPRNLEPFPAISDEWAIEGGLDGNTRRQSVPRQ